MTISNSEGSFLRFFYILLFIGLLFPLQSFAGMLPGDGTDSVKTPPPTPEQSEPVIMVLPFKTTDEVAHFSGWLGRGFSYYLTAGLRRNNIDVMQDSAVSDLLNSKHVVYPYRLSRATVLQLAKERKQRLVVWGEITIEKGAGHSSKSRKIKKGNENIRVHPVVLYTNPLRQKFLPVLKGNASTVHLMMAEMLKQVLKAVTEETGGEYPGDKVTLPHFRWHHSNFDIFIKTLLLTDLSQKLELLDTVERSDPGIALIHIHLLLRSGRKEEALILLFEALDMFPDNDGLIRLFDYFLGQESNRDQLASVFRLYIPMLRFPSQLPPLSLEIDTPIGASELEGEPEPAITSQEFREIQVQFHSGEVTTAFENLQRMLKENPFAAEFYQLMAEIYKKKKDRSHAELYQAVADYLTKE